MQKTDTAAVLAVAAPMTLTAARESLTIKNQQSVNQLGVGLGATVNQNLDINPMGAIAMGAVGISMGMPNPNVNNMNNTMNMNSIQVIDGCCSTAFFMLLVKEVGRLRRPTSSVLLRARINLILGCPLSI